jgi:hypothetical protein
MRAGQVKGRATRVVMGRRLSIGDILGYALEAQLRWRVTGLHEWHRSAVTESLGREYVGSVARAAFLGHPSKFALRIKLSKVSRVSHIPGL